MANLFVVGDLVWPTQKWRAAMGYFDGLAEPGLVTQVLKDSGPCQLGFYYVVLFESVERTIHETSISPRPNEE